MSTKTFWLARDGHQKFPFALFGEPPTYNSEIKGWDQSRSHTPASHFRLTLSDFEAGIMFGTLPDSLAPGRMVEVQITSD